MTDRGREILKRVVERIGDVSPPGLGRWDPAWHMIADPSDVFLDALSTWERNDTPETRDTLHSSASDFVRAWRRAAQAWENEGRPGAGEKVMANV